MHPKLPAFFSDFWMGCMFFATGIYGFAYMYFSPRKKLSDVLTNKQYRWIFAGFIVFGVVLAISNFVFPNE